MHYFVIKNDRATVAIFIIYIKVLAKKKTNFNHSLITPFKNIPNILFTYRYVLKIQIGKQ